MDLNPVDIVRIFNLLREKIPENQDEEAIFQRILGYYGQLKNLTYLAIKSNRIENANAAETVVLNQV